MRKSSPICQDVGLAHQPGVRNAVFEETGVL
jgi:hypothetical protein